MSLIYKSFLILSCLFLASQIQASSNEDQGPLVDAAKMWLELSHQNPVASPNAQQREQIAGLLTATQNQVEKDLAIEAAQAGLSTEKYLETHASLAHFLSGLKSAHTEKMSQPELLIFLIEGGARLQRQMAVRFPPPFYFQEIEEARTLLSGLSAKLGITI